MYRIYIERNQRYVNKIEVEGIKDLFDLMDNFLKEENISKILVIEHNEELIMDSVFYLYKGDIEEYENLKENYKSKKLIK